LEAKNDIAVIEDEWRGASHSGRRGND
jgi:hypothetical protein